MMNDIVTVTIPKTEYDKLLAENAELTQKVEWLMEQFRLFKHRQFGSSSEKSEYDQMSLFNEAEAAADSNVREPELIEVEKHYRKRKRSAKERLPENIPVEVVEHELPADEQFCAECGGGLHVMGRDSRRELVIIPAQVKIREHVSKVYACRICENSSDHTPIVKAATPAPVIKGSFASAEAIAHIMTQKYVMGVPLHRQEQEWNRQGIMLSRQTMSNWLLKVFMIK
jgi:transposase